MIRRLEQAYPYLLLATAVIPLIFIDGLLYPYVAPKTFLLRGIVIVALSLFSYLVLSGKEFFFGRLRSKITWVPGALLVVAYVSTAMGADFYHGFWSTYDRGDGLVSLTAVIALYYLILVYADRFFYERFINVVSWTGTIVAIYAVLQWIVVTTGAHIPLVAVSHGRVGSTLGNAAFLSGYMGITFLVTLATAWHSEGSWRKFWYVGSVLQICAIFIAATRGTLLALVLAGIVALLYAAVSSHGRIRTYARTAIVGVIIVATLFVVFRSDIAKIPIEFLHRVATISVSDTTVSSRLFVWKNMLPQAMSHPILGTGAETIETIFNRVYDPGKILEQWFDRTHNSFLDYFVQYGILGLLLYCALIFGILYNGIRRYRDDGEKDGLLFALLAFVYAVSDFFVFDTAVAFSLLLAIAALVPYGINRKNDKLRTLPFRSPKAVPIVVSIIILLLLIPVSITPLRANLLLADGYVYHIVDVRRSIASMNQGLSLGTYADLEYGYQAYDMYTERQQNMLSGEARVLAYQYARDILQKNFTKYPFDARTATYFGHVLDSAPPEVTRDETLERAVLSRAILFSPKRSQAWYMLANISLRKGDALSAGAEKVRFYREAISTIEEYSKMIPETAEPRYILATLYLTIGDRESAKHWADEALVLYPYDGSLATAKRASRYYVTIGDWTHAEQFLADIVSISPDDYGALYDFAKAAFLAGHKEKGVAAAAVVKQYAPTLFASDAQFVRAYDAWVAEHK